jgi:hypothetical protein
MGKSSFLLFALAGLCRADLISFPSLPTAQYAATTPISTPPGEVVFPGSVFVTPVASGPQVYQQTFFIPADWDVFGVALSIKTNGPTEASINGVSLGDVTNSTILNILPFVHVGENVLDTPLPGDGVVGLKVDDTVDVFYAEQCDPPAATPEPATFALCGAGLLALVWRWRNG